MKQPQVQYVRKTRAFRSLFRGVKLYEKERLDRLFPA